MMSDVFDTLLPFVVEIVLVIVAPILLAGLTMFVRKVFVWLDIQAASTLAKIDAEQLFLLKSSVETAVLYVEQMRINGRFGDLELPNWDSMLNTAVSHVVNRMNEYGIDASEEKIIDEIEAAIQSGILQSGVSWADVISENLLDDYDDADSGLMALSLD